MLELLIGIIQSNKNKCNYFGDTIFDGICRWYDNGIIQTIGYAITIASVGVFIWSVLTAKRALKNNRKAEMFFKMREYYLDYLKDVAEKDSEVELLGISAEDLKNSCLNKKQLVSYYKILLIIERVINYNNKFGIPDDTKEWEPWIISCLKSGDFRNTWRLFKPLYLEYNNSSVFITVMDRCESVALDEIKKRTVD